MKTLFYETTTDLNQYTTIAVTKNNSNIDNLRDMEGMKACFPTYDGIAWNSVKYTLYENGLIRSCGDSDGMAEFFGSSCVPNLPKTGNKKLIETCENSDTDSEMEAIRCLTSGRGDVAFISRNSLQRFVNGNYKTAQIINLSHFKIYVSEERESFRNRYKLQDFKVVCANSRNCHFSWAPLSYGMVRGNSTDLWLNDTLNIFLQLDELFGKSSKEITSPFTLFGLFDGKPNVLFHDATSRLRNVPNARDSKKMSLPYEDLTEKLENCPASTGNYLGASIYIILVTSFVLKTIN